MNRGIDYKIGMFFGEELHGYGKYGSSEGYY